MVRCFVVLAMLGSPVWACSCGGNWPSVKQAWQGAPAVFLATISSATPEEGRQFEPQKVQLRVDEAFKGVSKGEIIELNQGGTDCDAKFRKGDQLVFYLQRKGASYVVPWCTTATGSPDPGGDDLLFLHGLPKSAEGTRLSGVVQLYEQSPTDAFKLVRGLSRTKVTIRGPSGTRDVLTNASGTYEVYDLKPGTYSVDIEVPQNLTIYFPTTTGSRPVPGNQAAVELAKDGAASVSFVLMADTRLSGHMLDAKGTPIKDVCIDLEPVGGGGANGSRHFDCSEEDGWFEMTRMPPGDYWLVAKDKTDPNSRDSESTLYYPGVRDRRQAKVFSVAGGQVIGSVEFRLTTGEKRHKILGRFEFADGVPIGNRRVTFTDSEAGYKETASTSPDGSFTLSIIAGMKGSISGIVSSIDAALTSCPEFRARSKQQGLFRYMDADPVSVVADSDRDDVTVTLASPSCPALKR